MAGSGIPQRQGLEERRRVRRAVLIDAGVDLLGAQDTAPVTVRAVCRKAGLTERYFYESFHDRDSFVRSVYDELGGRATEALERIVRWEDAADGERARAAVEAFITLMIDRPAMGRALLIAPLTEPALSRAGVALAPAFVDMVFEGLSMVRSVDERRMRATGLVGAFTALFIGYLDGTLTVGRDELVNHCVRMLVESGIRTPQPRGTAG